MHHFKDQSLWFVQSHAFSVMITVWKIGLLLFWSTNLQHSPSFTCSGLAGQYSIFLCVHSFLPTISIKIDGTWVLVLVLVLYRLLLPVFVHLLCFCTIAIALFWMYNWGDFSPHKQNKLLRINVRLLALCSWAKITFVLTQNTNSAHGTFK